MMNIPRSVVIKGAGDLASGVAHRLWQAGFDVIMLELPRPLVIRRTVAFAAAVYEGAAPVEGVTARLCGSVAQAAALLKNREIPVLVDPAGATVRRFSPGTLVDAVMAKQNTGTALGDAPLVIGVGPGFTAGADVHAVIETKRGHSLGRVIYAGTAEANTGIPGEIAGAGAARLLRAPGGGVFRPLKEIGSLVAQGETVALAGESAVIAQTGGLLRGLLYPGLTVTAGMKVGDIDPRGAAVDYRAISDKARSVGGGVLEAILHRYLARS
jgi:xanthine dehydrogenase accessory factor